MPLSICLLHGVHEPHFQVTRRSLSLCMRMIVLMRQDTAHQPIMVLGMFQSLCGLILIFFDRWLTHLRHSMMRHIKRRIIDILLASLIDHSLISFYWFLICHLPFLPVSRWTCPFGVLVGNGFQNAFCFPPNSFHIAYVHFAFEFMAAHVVASGTHIVVLESTLRLVGPWRWQLLLVILVVK